MNKGTGTKWFNVRENCTEFCNLTSFSDVIKPDSGGGGSISKKPVSKLSSSITLIDQEVPIY